MVTKFSLKVAYDFSCPVLVTYKRVAYKRVCILRSSRQEVFLKIWQNLQKNICEGISFLTKLQASNYHLPLKMRPQHRCFPGIFKNTYFAEYCEQLLMYLIIVTTLSKNSIIKYSS